MEKLILKRLLKRGKTDFLTLRYDFPITPEFAPAFENLEKLELIESEKKNNETLISLTPKGIDANIKGLEKWAEKKVYSEIKDNCFGLTKDTSSIEINALRNLEGKGFILEVENSKYKVNPQKKLISKKINLTTSDKRSVPYSTSPKKRKKTNWKMILKPFLWLITLIISVLAIIENKYHYVTSAWEWILNLTN